MLRSLLLCAVCGSVSVLLPADVWRLWSRWFTDWLGIAAGPASVRLFTKSELSRYTGEKGSPGLYLAILGQVFDVKKGKKHYGPGGSYSFFSGRDACRAFVSGDFTENGLVDDVSGLSPSQILSLHEWLDFYKKEYTFKGKLVGTYYNHNGEPTQVLSDVELAVTQGRKLKAESELENNLFPPCNSEWSSAKGGRVWCSPHSGGVEREWAGVPRKLYRPGSKSHRCVCVRTTGPPSNQPNSAQNRGDLENPSLQEYAGCHSLSVSCALP
ncbi:neuferricin isoform X2 [Stegostoma tigrinum]|uniref:neuferricin isoform X2 n=1 Tax=Stegostoma tigrinum TaxID=3053191 RepID=UPI00202B6C71|nr:neuferricin isoform X2 [Stegostoma tigrinum]